MSAVTIASQFALALFTGLLAAAVAIDLRHRRLPNALNAATGVAGLLSSALAPLPGLEGGLGPAVIGALVMLAALLPCHALRLMGAGDVKLLTALAAWLGLANVGWLLLSTCLAGGVVALVAGLHSGALRRVVRNMAFSATATVVELQAGGARTVRRSAGRLPYALPIALGAVLALARHHVGR